MRLLRQLMVEVAAETAARHVCRFQGVTDEAAPEICHAVGMLMDVGKGELRAGIEVVRENHKWAMRVRDRAEKVGLAITISGMGLILSATLGALWVGIRHAIGKG